MKKDVQVIYSFTGKTFRLNEECEIDKQCQENSICKDYGNGRKFCTCDQKYVADHENNKCLLKSISLSWTNWSFVFEQNCINFVWILSKSIVK